MASAKSNPDPTPSRIMLTGSGTFNPEDEDEVTGGGTWKTEGPVGAGNGTYDVTGLVHWTVAAGTPPPLTDEIGDPADARAEFVVLSVHYSNGMDGIVVVSCHLVGTPDTVFEGITASMGFVDFWNREAPQDEPFVDANRTLFHVVRD
jgi:hypothetical protein